MTNLIQPGLDALTHGPLHNNPIPVNMFFAVAGAAVSIAMTWYVHVQGKRYQEEVNLADTAEERMSLLCGESEDGVYGTVETNRNGVGARANFGS
jgi:hypothetical protein